MLRQALWSVLLLVAIGCGGKQAQDTSIAVPETPLVYAHTVTPVQLMFKGTPVLYYVPPNARGVVFGFHGSNGGVGFSNKLETIALLNALLERDIGFAIGQSLDREAKQWDLTSSKPSENADLQHMLDLRTELIASTEMTENTALFAFGFSNGGSFAGVFAKMCENKGLPIRAVASHSSTCFDCGETLVPTYWSIPEQDQSEFVAEIKAKLDAKGVDAAHQIIPELPIFPDYFTRDPTVDDTQSQRTFDELVSFEMINNDGVRLIPDSDADAWAEQYGRTGQVPGADLREEQLRVAWTLHRMNAYHAKEIRDFFAKRL